jgi:hypothetical protein
MKSMVNECEISSLLAVDQIDAIGVVVIFFFPDFFLKKQLPLTAKSR